MKKYIGRWDRDSKLPISLTLFMEKLLKFQIGDHKVWKISCMFYVPSEKSMNECSEKLSNS